MNHFLVSEEHFLDHIAPLALAMNGTVWATNGAALTRGTDLGLDMHPVGKGMPTIKHIVVASYGDLKYSRRYAPKARRVLLQHGSGQSYNGSPTSRRHPSYSGGIDHADVGLFLVPNSYSGDAWQKQYPEAKVVIVGCPRIDTLPRKERRFPPVVAISFHWQCGVVDEAKSTFQHYRHGIELLQKDPRWQVLGHSHPRIRSKLAGYYRRYGVEIVDDFNEVCERADVYIIDNSSTMFEFAATGRPVVVMNAPWYRKDINHGMRFWELASVGTQVEHPKELLSAVELALRDPRGLREERERIVNLVYPIRQGATEIAVAAIQEWL